MANSYSTSDLVKGALWRAGESTDGTSPLHPLALKYVNEVYHSVLSGSNEFDPDIGNAWVWARTQRHLVLKTFNETGNVTLTTNSLNGTFSSAPAISMAGYYLILTNGKSYYTIATHTAGATAFTLESVFVEDTVTTSFKAIPLSYDLGSGILRLVEPLRIYVDRELENFEKENDEGRIYGMDLDRYREDYPLRDLRNGTPTKFCTYSRSEDEWLVFVNKYVSDPIKVDYDVIEIQQDLVDSDQDIPLIPREFRKILEFGAAHYLCIDKTNAEKATYFFAQTKTLLKAMQLAENKNDTQVDKAYGRIVPRLDNQRYRNWLIY